MIIVAKGKTVRPIHVDANNLDKLTISQLRRIAFDLGISGLATKVHNELVAEIRWEVEYRELYRQVYE